MYVKGFIPRATKEQTNFLKKHGIKHRKHVAKAEAAKLIRDYTQGWTQTEKLSVPESIEARKYLKQLVNSRADALVFHVGSKVVCQLNGEGEVIEIHPDFTLSIRFASSTLTVPVANLKAS